MQPDIHPLRIFALWTRDLDAGEQIGRVNTARAIRTMLAGIAPLTNARLTNVFEDPRPIWSILCSRTAMALLAGLLSFRPLPLQCALFAAAARRLPMPEDGKYPDVVYLDGIRTLLWLRRLRKASPGLRIIVDLDDLMSRRYELLARSDLPLSLGYLERALPRPVLSLIRAKSIARLLLWYERLALRRAEKEVLRLADCASLVNSTEASLLRRMGADTGTPVRAMIATIPPMAKQQRTSRLPALPVQPGEWHAIFVGSDTLPQNRLTIAYLVDLWSTTQMKTKLMIYGRQKVHWPVVPNVTFYGYVEDIGDAYKPGSILVCPSLLAGGIKTKVLEAFGYGVPVVGNGLTFEGILPPGYPLMIECRSHLVALLQDPGSHAAVLMRAAEIGSAYLAREHSATAYAARWREVVLGHRCDQQAASAAQSDDLEYAAD
jgi:hypothetical protein